MSSDRSGSYVEGSDAPGYVPLPFVPYRPPLRESAEEGQSVFREHLSYQYPPLREGVEEISPFPASGAAGQNCPADDPSSQPRPEAEGEEDLHDERCVRRVTGSDLRT